MVAEAIGELTRRMHVGRLSPSQVEKFLNNMARLMKK